LVAKMQRGFAAIEREAKKKKRRLRVYCEAWPNPRISSPPWVAELVRLCGGQMIVLAGEKVSEEQVVAANPDVIVLAWTATGKKAKSNMVYEVEAWKGVHAIRNRCVYVVSDELLNTPGPPLMAGAKELFRLLHSNEE